MTHVWPKELAGQYFNPYLLGVVLLIVAAGIVASLLATRRERGRRAKAPMMSSITSHHQRTSWRPLFIVRQFVAVSTRRATVRAARSATRSMATAASASRSSTTIARLGDFSCTVTRQRLSTPPRGPLMSATRTVTEWTRPLKRPRANSNRRFAILVSQALVARTVMRMATLRW